MNDSKMDSDLEIAKLIVDEMEKSMSVESDLDWWSALLESFYGASPVKPDQKRIS